MAKLHEISVLPTGRITVEVDPVTGATVPYVYQRVAKGKGNIPLPGPHDLQLRRHVTPSTGPTPEQAAKRAGFALAVAAWQALTTPEKGEWKNRARAMQVSGYNLFLREYLRPTTIPTTAEYSGIYRYGPSLFDGSIMATGLVSYGQGVRAG